METRAAHDRPSQPLAALRLWRRVWVLCLAVLAVGAARQPRPAPLVVISIDGLRPDYVLEADRLGLRIPHLRRLLLEGTHATRVVGVLPTVTYPSHTTLMTGVAPARHGILQNHPFDPLERDGGEWYWYAQDIRVPALWDVAAQAGLTTASVDWPVTVGAHITYNIPQYWRTYLPDEPGDRKLARALATPGLLEEAERALGPYPSGYVYDVDADVRRARFSAFLLETKRPQLQLVYFSGLDGAQHEHGPFSAEAFMALEGIDALVGEVRAAAERASEGQALVAVVSDHGFAWMDTELNVNAALRAAGLQRLDANGAPTNWQACAWSAGGSTAVMLRDRKDEVTLRAVGQILHGLAKDPKNHVERILEGEEVRAAGGFPDASFVVGMLPKPGVPGPLVHAYGIHGLLPSNPDMDAAFIMAGPGIAAGRNLGRIDMRDVAPTLAGRLGLVMATADGRDLL